MFQVEQHVGAGMLILIMKSLLLHCPVVLNVSIQIGGEEKEFSLNRSYYGLYVPRMVWREIKNFSTNSLALILSSTKYEENDYIRDRAEYASIVRKEMQV